MRILWICNVVPRIAADKLSLQPAYGGSWIEAMMQQIEQYDNILLTIIAPGAVSSLKRVNVGSVEVIVIPRSFSDDQWRSIIPKLNPDLVHIHGTEYEHGAALMRSAPELIYVISLQGVVSFYADHVRAGLPDFVTKRYSLRDFLKRDNILTTENHFREQGKIEKLMLNMCKGVIGRTNWDRSCAHWLAPNSQYYFCNENLRMVFYESSWQLSSCERHSLFLSQATYPIKGIHQLLDALPYLIPEFPDLKLYVAGPSNFFPNGVLDHLKQTSYTKYVEKRIEELGVRDRVIFTGPLDEERMCEQMRASHVFILPSSIENSPNSLGEAMMLGMPIVAADVGGVRSMMRDEIDGLLYPFNEPYSLAWQIYRIFSDDQFGVSMGRNAKEHAMVTHDRDANGKRMVDIYQDVLRRFAINPV